MNQLIISSLRKLIFFFFLTFHSIFLYSSSFFHPHDHDPFDFHLTAKIDPFIPLFSSPIESMTFCSFLPVLHLYFHVIQHRRFKPIDLNSIELLWLTAVCRQRTWRQRGREKEEGRWVMMKQNNFLLFSFRFFILSDKSQTKNVNNGEGYWWRNNINWTIYGLNPWTTGSGKQL